MTLNGVIALILRFFTKLIALLANYVTVVEETYNVCKILSPSSSRPRLAKTNPPVTVHRGLSAIAELLVMLRTINEEQNNKIYRQR